MKKEAKEKSTESKKPLKPLKNNRGQVNLKVLIIVWSAVLVILFVAFLIARLPQLITMGETWQLLSVITAFSAFVMQSLFSFSVLKHNAIIREVNDELKKNNEENNLRNEEFRTLQFISSNYTVVDFVDYMLLYSEFESYTNRLKETKDLTFYLKEQNIDTKDIFENFDQYNFVSLKIPFKIVEGKTIGKIRFSNFRFNKGERVFRFVSCKGSSHGLILHNENDHRSEVVVNFIYKKSSDFFVTDELNLFTKIKINLTMQSLLGVMVAGATELYFTNPLKLDKDGANKYKINSSHFEVIGMPTLVGSVEEDLKI